MPIARSVFSGRHIGGSPPGGSYTSGFALTQNPIVEDGNWRLGFTHGGDWTDPQTSGGRSCATAFATGVDDAVMIRAGGINTTRHFAQGTIGLTGGYSPTNGHELELCVGGTITSGSCSLYETLFSLTGAFQIVRWNGAYNDLNFGLTVTNQNGGPAQPTNGMVCRTEYFYNGSTVSLSVYQGGVLVATCTDPSPPVLLRSGQPGLSHFVQPGAGANLLSMGWDDFSCGTFP